MLSPADELQRRSLHKHGLTDAEIGIAVHRCYGTIWSWRRRRNLPAVGGRKVRFWSDPEVETLQRLYRGSRALDCAVALGRSRASVECKLRRICADRKRRPNSSLGKSACDNGWSTRELSVVKKYYREMDCTALAERLGRTSEAVQKRAELLGIRKLPPALRWNYRDAVFLLDCSVAFRELKLSVRRTGDAISSMKRLLRIAFAQGTIDQFLAKLPDAPTRLRSRQAQSYPPGLRRGWNRLTQSATRKLAREHLSREAERARRYRL